MHLLFMANALCHLLAAFAYALAAIERREIWLYGSLSISMLGIGLFYLFEAVSSWNRSRNEKGRPS